VEVKIGVQYAARELTVETEETQEAVEALVAEAIKGDGVLTLTDTRKRRIVVPGARISYVEIGGGTAGQVGFRS
jgi:hypothetical protein